MANPRIGVQFSIFLINKPGILNSVTSAFSDARVNLFALSLVDSGEHGVLRVVSDEPDRAREVLSSSHDRWTETDVLIVPISNDPGSFARIAGNLSSNNLDVMYSYCTSAEDGSSTTAIFKCRDSVAAMKVLMS